MEEKKLKVVLIDDDPIVLDIYARKFKDDNIDSWCTSGGVGVEEVLEFNPDVILLDIMMPSKSGFDYLKEFRSTEKGKAAKIFMLTNVADEEKVKESLALGADGHIIKAMRTPKEVIEHIRDSFGPAPKQP